MIDLQDSARPSSSDVNMNTQASWRKPSPIDVYNGKSIYLRFSFDNDKIKIYNSYKIKDTLKLHGFRYDPSDKSWYGTKVQMIAVANKIWSYLPPDIKEYCYLNGVRNSETDAVAKIIESAKIVQEIIKERESKTEELVGVLTEQIPQLKSYQIDAIKRILHAYFAGAKGFILEDEQGLGKTLQACSVVYSLFRSGRVKNVLIFTTKSLVQNFINEFIKFFSSTGFMLFVSNVIEYGKVVVISYSRVNTSDYDLLQNMAFDLIVLDEAQVIKNPNSEYYKKVKKIMDNSKFILVTSGTLIKNRPLECYNITKQLGLHNMTTSAFVKLFEGETAVATTRNYYHKYYKNVNKENVKRLRQFLQSTQLYLRRTKDEVLDFLPPKHRVLFPISLEGDFSIELHTALQEEQKIGEYLLRNAKLTAEMRKQLPKYRRIVGIHKVPYINKVIHALDLQNEHRLVIFVHHRDVGAKMAHLISENFPGIDIEILNGKTSLKERNRIVNRFQSDADENIWLIASLSAASEGLTLTKANKMIFAEIDYVPATLRQAEDRIHRISQEKPCFYYYFVAAQSLDSYVFRILEKKNEYMSVYYGYENNYEVKTI